jgi:protein-S-isoprenylcysteine O-methyltransferase Ste14
LCLCGKSALLSVPHKSPIIRRWPHSTNAFIFEPTIHATLPTMNRSAFITTLVPAIAIAYLLVKFSDLPWTALRILALLLTIAGIAAVAVARYQLGNSFTLSPQARTLVTYGLYSKIRNPVYVFSAIALAGLFVYIDRPIYLVSFLVLIPLQFIRAHIESRVLEEKFGDTYRQYKSKTWF